MSERITSSDIKEMRERVEEARPDGYGVGTLALDDVPRLLDEVERLRKYSDELLEWNRYYFAEYKRLKHGGRC